MTAKQNLLARAVEAQRPREVVRPVKIRNANAAPSRRNKVGQTIHYDLDVQQLLLEICAEQDTSIQALLREGLNLVLHKYNRKPIA